MPYTTFDINSEDEDLKKILITFDNNHFSKLNIQRITLEMTISDTPIFHPDYTITNAHDLEEKIIQHPNSEHRFSVYIHQGLWLNVHAIKNYRYFFSLLSTETAVLLLIITLLAFTFYLMLRLYRFTKLSTEMLTQLGIPNHNTPMLVLFQVLKIYSSSYKFASTI